MRGRPCGPRFPVAFRPPAFACWILLRPLRIGLPYGRLTRRTGRLDPIGVVAFRMRELRPGWVSPEPRGRRCAPDRRAPVQPAPAAFLRPVPTTRWCSPSAGACLTRHHQGFIRIHPSGLPQPVTHRWDEGPWALTSGFAPRGYPQRTLRRGQALHTGLGPPFDISRASLVASTPLKRPHVATAQCNSPPAHTPPAPPCPDPARPPARPAGPARRPLASPAPWDGTETVARRSRRGNREESDPRARGDNAQLLGWLPASN
jgi:hypothetical protein